MPPEPESSHPDVGVEEGREGLEMGLERIRLMILAEEDAGEIRKVWQGLKTEGVKDEGLRTRIEEARIQVDRLPPAPDLEEAQATPTIQIQTS